MLLNIQLVSEHRNHFEYKIAKKYFKRAALEEKPWNKVVQIVDLLTIRVTKK